VDVTTANTVLELSATANFDAVFSGISH